MKTYTYNVVVVLVQQKAQYLASIVKVVLDSKDRLIEAKHIVKPTLTKDYKHFLGQAVLKIRVKPDLFISEIDRMTDDSITINRIMDNSLEHEISQLYYVSCKQGLVKSSKITGSLKLAKAVQLLDSGTKTTYQFDKRDNTNIGRDYLIAFAIYYVKKNNHKMLSDLMMSYI